MLPRSRARRRAVGVMAYAAYGLSKPTSLAQPQQRSSATRSLGGSKFTGKYDGLNSATVVSP
jgi:hypothetical protein